MDDFFINDIQYDLNELIVSLKVKGEHWAKVVFTTPRAFRFFAESDEFNYLDLYDGTDLLSAGSGCRISQSISAPYLAAYLKNTPESRLEDDLRSVLIATAQECVEVIAFEPPEIQFAGDS